MTNSSYIFLVAIQPRRPLLGFLAPQVAMASHECKYNGLHNMFGWRELGRGNGNFRDLRYKITCLVGGYKNLGGFRASLADPVYARPAKSVYGRL